MPDEKYGILVVGTEIIETDVSRYPKVNMYRVLY